jgi:hypothetical protein
MGNRKNLPQRGKPNPALSLNARRFYRKKIAPPGNSGSFSAGRKHLTEGNEVNEGQRTGALGVVFRRAKILCRFCLCHDTRPDPFTSWRRLFDDIASGNLSVVNRPDKRVRAYQAKMRQPLIEQRQKQQTANWTARGERDRLRQEQNRRAAGIPPRGAQEALDEATGYRDESGRLTDPG